MNRAVTALRIIDTGVKPSRWNIAVTAALLELHRIGATPDTVRFHRYPRSVLIGRNAPSRSTAARCPDRAAASMARP